MREMKAPIDYSPQRAILSTARAALKRGTQEDLLLRAMVGMPAMSVTSQDDVVQCDPEYADN